MDDTRVSKREKCLSFDKYWDDRYSMYMTIQAMNIHYIRWTMIYMFTENFSCNANNYVVIYLQKNPFKRKIPLQKQLNISFRK